MFGFGSRSNLTPRRSRGSGILRSGGLRRAAIAGLGMLAYRWWRNRHSGGPDVARRPVGNW
jgi:hypothetical protein